MVLVLQVQELELVVKVVIQYSQRLHQLVVAEDTKMMVLIQQIWMVVRVEEVVLLL